MRFVTLHHWLSALAPFLLPTQAASDPLPPDYFYHLKFLLLLYFWLHWVFVAACELFSSVASGGFSLVASVQASHCSSFSSCGSWASECMGFSGWQFTGLVALQHVGS